MEDRRRGLQKGERHKRRHLTKDIAKRTKEENRRET